MLWRSLQVRLTANVAQIGLCLLVVTVGCGKASKSTSVSDSKPAVVDDHGHEHTHSHGSGSDSHSHSSEKEVAATYAVPAGSSKQLLEFIKSLEKRQPKSQQEAQNHLLNTQNAIVRACDQILSQKSDDETLKEAVTRKFVAQIGLVANGLGGTPQSVIADVARLRQDPRPVVAEVANQFWVPARSLNVKSMSSEEEQQLADEAIESVTRTKASQESIRDGALMGDQLVNASKSDAAASFFDRLAEAISNATVDTKTRSLISYFQGRANRLRLQGSFMALEGALLDGEVFDWDSYRGKVVLVDFWATWCGPCVQELPNVRANYSKFHDRGFDVIGISLDSRRATLEEFVKREGLPWKQLFDAGPGSVKGWRHPMAVRYDVSTIPAAFLVDRDGKVISTNARGEELGRLLTELLGTAN